MFKIDSRLDVPDDDNNVQVISLSAEDVRTLVQISTTLRVKITRRSLSTLAQPVSIVVTGAFDFDSVVVNDDTSKDESDSSETTGSPENPDDQSTMSPSDKDEPKTGNSSSLIYVILSIVMYSI